MEPTSQRRFHVRYCLGRGGFGEVYRATMESPGGLRTEVALKVLRVDLGPDAEAVRRLRDEGRLLAALDHPVILRAFDLAMLDGRVGLVTEFVNGADLTSCIAAENPERMPPRAVVQAVGAVSEALHVAWTAPSPESGQPLRLIHRDIKPSNIRIGTHGEVKLLDFGIARSEQVDREARTGTGSTVGSLSYMAPERFGRAAAAPPADVYGLGCTLFEGLTGGRLFPDAVPVEMFRLAADPIAHAAHVEEALTALPHADDELRALLELMLAHDPADRPTAHEVALTCEELADTMPGATLKRWARDHTWPAPSSDAGHFDGRTLTEGTIDTSGIQAPPAPPPVDAGATFALDLPPEDAPAPHAAPPPRRRAPWLALGLGGAALVAVVGFLGLATVTTTPLIVASDGGEARQEQVRQEQVRRRRAPGAAQARQPRSAAPEPAEVPEAPTTTERPEPLAAAVPAASGTPEGAPEPAPAPSPAPRPAPAAATAAPAAPPSASPPAPASPAPAPAPAGEAHVEPAPAPAEPSRAEPIRTGTVAASSAEVRIELRADGAVHGPGEVPVGRYDLYADFGSGPLPRGRVDVVEGRRVTVRCNTLTYGCDVED